MDNPEKKEEGEGGVRAEMAVEEGVTVTHNLLLPHPQPPTPPHDSPPPEPTENPLASPPNSPDPRDAPDRLATSSPRPRDPT